MKSRNRRKKIILIISALVIVFTAIICTGSIIANRKYNIKNVVKAEVICSVAKTVTVSEKKDIDVLLKCVKLVKANNKTALKDIATAPIWYTIKFFFKNGTSREYEYVTYPSKTYSSPFSEFYELESVKNQNPTA